ncbi:MAG TPA: ABC-three component system protein [Streptosporangiaceae bacterium]|nr:ABC-three component system protein [Streptosporangiaceae bacterium]
MLFEQRMFVLLAFLKKMTECHGEEFQEFFHDLMCHRDPGFIDVCTAGKLGDLGADGLMLYTRQLYACYAPQTFDASAMKSKYNSDLESALEKREGQFDTFIFVFPDIRGTHPEIPTLLARSKEVHPDLNFESMGCRKLWNEVMRLETVECEDLFGSIPVTPVVYGVGLADLAPLLDHLKANRIPADPTAPVDKASLVKMDYNQLSTDCREQLVRGMRDSHLVQEYHDGLIDQAQHDEVAAGFSDYYRQVRDRVGDNADEIMWELERYILGNEHPKLHVLLATGAILTHFFERCHIFEAPPPGWQPSTVTVGSV